MSDHMTDWVAAYYDGELAPERRAWVEEHLAACAECRRELDALRALSSLLQEDPLPAMTASAPGRAGEAYVERVLAQLPRPRRPWWQAAARANLRYAPLWIFAAWAFTQALLTVSALLALVVGLLPGAAAWLPLSERESLWQAGTEMSLSMLGLDSLIAPLEWLSPFLFLDLALMVVFAVLFLAWLAGLWSLRRVQAVQSVDV